MSCLYNSVLKNAYVTYQPKLCYLGGEEEHEDNSVSLKTMKDFHEREVELDQRIKNAEIEIEARRKIMVNNLKREVDAIAEKAKNDCHELLMTRAQEGFAEGMKVAQSKCDNLDSEFENIKNSIVAEYNQKYELLENNILDIAMVLARKIIDIQLEKDDAVIISSLKSVMERFKDEKNLSLEVSEEIAQKLNSQADKLFCIVNANKELSNDEVFLNTNYGTIDASIDVQFDNLKNSMLEECKKL